MWGYKQGGLYVSCSHLRDAMSCEVHSWWIMCVGLQTGRSIELDYERGAHPIYFGFGDDRVMRYTEADDVAGGAGIPPATLKPVVLGLQPNTPQPSTHHPSPSIHTGATGSICWCARGVKGQVGGSIPTGNNPPSMNGRRRVMGWGASGYSNLTCSGTRDWCARGVTGIASERGLAGKTFY
ncbi:hypothetical protein DEO72_LG5g920 [Vigna unguiculata]|uniref:Uncharacterized protein n=1 Tax=Vigna unguiculata TaxID=3917 RepID=A0A4D6LWR5_VIGUN|nr:hypothetical protein DEO72_LG5g920 [Vigna unguiculata]